MPKCQRIRRRHRKICIADLDTFITLQNRTLTPPPSGVDASEVFSGNQDVWSLLETKRGASIFDSNDTEITVTHFFYIRFLLGIDVETWILLVGQRYDIIDVENLEERDEWLLLRCNIRGDAVASDA